MTAGSAQWIAAVRARESDCPDRLFSDPFAHDLAGPLGFERMAASERATGGENQFLPVRVRWFDDVTMAAVSDGVRQVVLLGAGMDTRAYRLELPSDLDWYELDRPEVLAGKTIAAPPLCRRHAVGADLSANWAGSLLAAGFRRDTPTLWLAEGLFFYLTEAMIVAMLREAAVLSGPGSRVAADVMSATGLDTPAMRPYRAWCERNGMPPPFGSDDPVGLLSDGGWRADRVTAPGAPDANYGRLPESPDGVVPGRVHLVIGMAQPD
ncbi:SAM-dependent methyltransferase [Actinoplanes sp. TBRC 11911]|uniref:class I SAM-dependent methyltransferase n=1 Tax=Actinoplanes sp. TBRC 11911 TaxID=2729386 RepID=UPI00145DC084|nr:SAM-dependent methyltransferase [Actinoplanes sp. TBRC 11911]NMO51209.1 SAM-dependent methyltransferase [Actinoplanes sp. TBRC 11911]